MGIYSEDRTMLTIDPMADSKVMKGYEAVSDLYKIMEESLEADAIIYTSIIESEASMITLEEADGAKTNKRAEMIQKMNKAILVKVSNAVAKMKSILASIAKKMSSFKENKVDKMLAKYEGDFNRNKDLAMSPKFSIKYNKDALLCTNKELEKFAKESCKTANAVVKDSYNLAKANITEIEKNRHNVFKVSALSKYAEKFCCCCDKKAEIIEGNPFKDGLTPDKLVKELKTSSIQSVIDEFNVGAAELVASTEKLVATLNKDAAKESKNITGDDMAALHSMVSVIDGAVKGLTHSAKDIIACRKQYVSECVKLYIAVAKLKAVREDLQIKYVTTDEALCEANLISHDLQLELDM